MNPRELPVTVIRPAGRGLRPDFRALFAARYMLWNLVRSAALAPYTDVALSFFWTFARPFIFLGVIVFLRNQSGARMEESVEYPAFVLSGLVLWWYFTDATRQSARSLYRYRGLLTKVFFPRIITPAVPVLARLLDLGVQLVAAVPLMLHYGRHPDWHLLLLPLVVVHVALLSVGLGYIFAVLSAGAKDFERMLDFALYVALFVSPVIFSVHMVPAEFRDLYALLNPMVGPLEVIRAALFSGVALDLRAWGLSAISTTGILIIGLITFSRHEADLAERIT